MSTAILDGEMFSDDHTARAAQVEPGLWEITGHPFSGANGFYRGRNTAITGMTLAEIVTAGRAAVPHYDLLITSFWAELEENRTEN